MSSILSQIVATVAGLAIVTTAFVVYPGDRARNLAKSLTVAVSLAIVAAVLISVARNFGS